MAIFFDYVKETYHYKLIIINCESRNFEDIYAQKRIRDMSDKRHKSHLSSIYINSNNWILDEYEFSDDIKYEEYLKFMQFV